MSNWFLVTSAINVSYNSSRSENRFEETIKTIESIRDRCPDSRIAILESGNVLLEDNQIVKLKSLCDVLAPFNSNETLLKIREFSKNNIQYIKSPSEIFILKEFLKTQNFISHNDRIFKISGRYQLSSEFDFNRHNLTEKIVVANKKPSVQYFCSETQKKFPFLGQYQYKTRLYSFSGVLVQYMIMKYEQMFNYVIDLYQNNYFNDIEHLMYGFLDREKIMEINPVGVCGIFADTGEYIQE